MIEKFIRIENESSYEKIDDKYLPIINTVKDSVPHLLGPNIEEIRLLGSIPRGEAIPEISDIDFLIITKEPLSDDRKREIQMLSKALHKKYPFVWSVDLTIMDMQSLSKAPDYELIISTDSISLYGIDSYSKQSVDILNTELNQLWGILPSHFENKYKQALHDASTDKELKQISKWIGKDMLKCFRREIISEHGILDRNMKALYLRLKEHYPADSWVFDELYRLYSSPIPEKLQLENILEASIEIYKELVWDKERT